MRTSLLSLLVILGSVSALAQSTGKAKQLRDKSRDVEDTSNAADDTSSGDAAEAGGADAPAAAVGTGDAPGAEHRVEKGDTLWDLSQRYLGSPWYWPKVWSYNPDIANPHWIYPGNNVRFYSSAGGEGPTRVEAGGEPAAGEAPSGAGTELGDVEEGSMIPDEGEDRVQVSGQVGYKPKKTVTLAATGFVTSREIEESGSIVGSYLEADLLCARHPIYIEFKNKRPAKLGENFVIFRSMGEVIHPVTRGLVGYQTRILGVGHVTRVEKKVHATAIIDNCYEAIERGDLLGPGGEPVSHAVALRANEKELSNAYVVGSTTSYLTTFGEHQLLIIDRGTEDGVQVGNTFTIFRQHDSLSQEIYLDPTIRDEAFPKEDIASCMAFEVKTKATTCLVTRSIQEIVRGDHVEMHATSARSER
ncbi:MAG: LysM peptidoglycan-binding domain-containing protein [Archangium sp.]|nr:LysM peptidoglycan-binding domain-containing protein [Archangium sp.]